MDKLKPVIEQKFWIFLGLALILPFVGWYLATSGYAKGVEERESLIESTFGKMQISGNVANQVWVDGADVLVQEEQKKLEVAQKDLWNSQRASMTWPPDVQAYMQNVPYEGVIADQNIREYFSQSYFRQLRELEQRLRPFDYETGEGVLLFDPSSYTQVPANQWQLHAPTSQEMWNAQIDYWLVRAVFDSIISINQTAEKITEAPVRRLIELRLRGGERDYSGAASGSGGSGDGMTEDSAMYSDMGMAGSSESGYGSGGGGGAFKADVKFDLSEELGPAAVGSLGGTSYGGGGMDEAFASVSGEGGYGDSAEGSGETTGPDRYVDDNEGYPFRTRAFVLGVVMDHGVLPDFLSELSRSDWPIQIIRVQTRALNLEQLPLAERSGTRTNRYGGGIGGRSMQPGFGAGSYGGADEGYSAGGGTGFSPLPGSSSGGGYSADSGSTYTGSQPGLPGVMSPGAGPGARNAAGLARQAMTDPYLSEVWIGGLITLFRPVEDDATTAAGDSQSPGGVQGTESIDAAAGSAPNAALPGTTAGEGEQGPSPANPVPADGSSAPDAGGLGTDASDGSSSPAPGGTGTERPPTPPDSSSRTDN